MDCGGLHRLLSEKCLAELTVKEREAVAAHVAGCPACRDKWGLNHQSQILHNAIKAALGRKPGDGPSASPPGS